MKKLTLNRGRAMTCLILMLFLFLIHGCKKDLLQPNSKDLQNGLSIAEARQYFDANLRKATKPEKLMSNAPINNDLTMESFLGNKQPLWDRAYAKMISIGGAVKIPIDFGKAYAVVNPRTKAMVPLTSLNYLLMYKDSLQTVHAEWVILQPDSAWLYGNRNKYTGHIVVKDWNGRTIKKFSYNDHSPKTTAMSIKNRTLSSTAPTSLNAESQDSPPLLYCVSIQRGGGACTCVDKSNCDMCPVCAKTFCDWPDPECALCNDPPGGNTGGNLGGGGGGGSGVGSGGSGDYPPQNCNSDPNYVDPHIVNADGSMSIPDCDDIPVPTQPPIEQTPTVIVTPAQFLINTLSIYDVQSGEFLNNNPAISEALINYLDANGATTENKDFIKWAIGYLMENPDVPFSELVEANNIPNSSINLPNLIDTTGLSPYPSFKTIVSNMPAFLNEHPEVIASLSRYTGFSKTKIMQLMQPGKGPKIELVSNLNDNGNPVFGQYIKGSSTLKIKKELVVGLDKVQSPNRYAAIGMLLAIVTLHEFVHYGRDVNKLTKRININGISYEAGLIFELSISPTNNYNYIDRNNAIDWVKFFNFNIND